MSLQWSHLRCPRSSCPDYHRPLALEIGQDESRGDLTVEHRCPSCDYVEFGPSTPTAAWRTSRLEAIERLRQQRVEGFRIPLKYDDKPVEVADV